MYRKTFEIGRAIDEIELINNYLKSFDIENNEPTIMYNGISTKGMSPYYEHMLINDAMHFKILHIANTLCDEFGTPIAKSQYKDLWNIRVRVGHNVIKYKEYPTNTEEEIKVLRKYCKLLREVKGV